MHYFKFDIDYFLAETRSLSRAESFLYIEMICLYYKNEAPLPSDLTELFLIFNCCSRSDKKMLHKVTKLKFIETEGFFVHKKAEDEIKRFKENAHKNSKNIRSRWLKSSEEAEGEKNTDGIRIEYGSGTKSIPNIGIYKSINLETNKSKNKINTNTENEENKNQEEINTHIARAGEPDASLCVPAKKPRAAKKPRVAKEIIDKPESVDDEIWEGFLAVAKLKKHVITKIGLEKIEREGATLNLTLNETLRTCVERGWKSFQAEWILKNQNQTGAVGEMKRNFKGDFIGMSHHDSLMLENEMAIQEAVRLFNLREGIEK